MWPGGLYSLLPFLLTPSSYPSFGLLVAANVTKAQHFSMLVKVNYENQRKLTAKISKSAEKLMNFRKNV